MNNSRKFRNQFSAKTILMFCVFFVAFNRITHVLFSAVLRAFLGPKFEWFVERWQLDSDMLVRTRLQSNLDHGIFSFVFSLGQDGEYISQIGIGGWLLTLPVFFLHKIGFLGAADYTLPISEIGSSGLIGLGIMYSLVALLNTGISLWCFTNIRERAGLARAIIFTLLLFQPWSLAINSSLFWIIGIKILPGIYVLNLLMNRSKITKKNWVILLIISLITFSSGYEFSTIVVISVVMPCLYYLLSNQSRTPREFVEYLKFIFTVVMGFGLTLMNHFFILLIKFKSFSEATQAINQIIYKRTGIASTDVDSIYQDSLEATPISVLTKYLQMPVFGDQISGNILYSFRVWHLILLATFAWIWKTLFTREEGLSRIHLSLGSAWLVGLLGPVGWYLLARPHSAGHTHIDYALWFVYTLPLGAAFIWGRYPAASRDVKNVRLILSVLSLVAVMFSIMLLVSIYLVA